MRSDYILIGILSFIAFTIWLIMKKISKNATRCCGDCVKYKECWKSFNINCYETRACSGFEERYSDFNRD